MQLYISEREDERQGGLRKEGCLQSCESTSAEGTANTVEMTDFSNSYISWDAPYDPSDRRVPGHMPWGNSARILVDARCTLLDGASEVIDELYLIAPCRGEWMYQEENLFQIPSAEFRLIYARDRYVQVGKKMIEDAERPGSRPSERFQSLTFSIQSAPSSTELTTDDAVIAATLRNLPINAKTEIWDDASGLRAILEYPIRTMNYHVERRRFQVDTGPLIFPDLSATVEYPIDRCALAHIIYNRFDRAEFICKRPTPVMHEGQEIARIQHYSDVRSMPAKHTLLCAGEL
jgi:hypothetical protein